MEEKNLARESNSYINVECKIYYELLDQPYEFDISKATRKEIVDFVNKTYLSDGRKFNNVNSVPRDDLLINLVTIKTYRDELEMRIGNSGRAKDLTSFAVSLFSAFAAIFSLSKIKLGYQELYIFFVPLLVYTALRFFLDRRDSLKNSMSSKLIGVNYAVHVLEIILEEMNRADADESKIAKDINIPLNPKK